MNGACPIAARLEQQPAGAFFTSTVGLEPLSTRAGVPQVGVEQIERSENGCRRDHRT
jgi:hypothetical protein